MRFDHIINSDKVFGTHSGRGAPRRPSPMRSPSATPTAMLISLLRCTLSSRRTRLDGSTYSSRFRFAERHDAGSYYERELSVFTRPHDRKVIQHRLLAGTRIRPVS